MPKIETAQEPKQFDASGLPLPVVIYEIVENCKVMLAKLTYDPEESAAENCGIKVDFVSEQIMSRLFPVLENAKSEIISSKTHEETDNLLMQKWHHLIASCKEAGFCVQVLPAGDVSLSLTYDVRTGKTLANQTKLHEFASPVIDLEKRVSASIIESFKTASEDATNRLNEALATNSPDAVLDAFKHGLEAGAFSFHLSDRALLALEAIDVSSFGAADREMIRGCRLQVAHTLQRYDVAASEASALLADKQLSFTSEQIASLSMLIAMSEITKGHTEAAISIWRRLLQAPCDLNASNRGWAWRNLSLALPSTDGEAREAARYSSDAFLEAGERMEAGRSLMRLVDCLMFDKPEAAIDVMQEVDSLCDKNDLWTSAIRAAFLHTRARRLSNLSKNAEALHDAEEAVQLRRGVAGAEDDLISSLHLAALEAAACGDPRAADFRREAEALTDLAQSRHFQLSRRVESLFDNFDLQEAEAILRKARETSSIDIVAAALILIGTRDKSLDESQRLSVLEGAIQELRRSNATENQIEPVRIALSQELLKAKQVDRAKIYLRSILLNNPANQYAEVALLNVMWAEKDWDGSVALITAQIGIFGRLPNRLFALGKSLLEARQYSQCVSIFTELLELIENNSDFEKVVRDLREVALRKGGSIPPSVPPPPLPTIITLPMFEEGLRRFGNYVSASQRMSFWNKPVREDYSWIARPEKHAQYLLHTFLKGQFHDKISIFEELASGAGRLDIYVQLAGGLSFILELKMCGFGYSSAYASAGEEQILHYMNNRRSNLGFLVVLDSRLTSFGQTVLKVRRPTTTVFEIFVDVRPRVTLTHARAKPKSVVPLGGAY